MAAPITSEVVACDDFLQFQEMLKKLRMNDDRIIHSLNTTLPTDSFSSQVDPQAQCHQLYDQLCSGYVKRDKMIKSCISQLSTKISDLKSKCHDDNDDPMRRKCLRKEQTNLRLLQAEVNIEEVVKDRTLKVFNERCRNYYKPPPFTSL